jgi:cytochrome c-type biogenesis protein CcmH
MSIAPTVLLRLHRTTPLLRSLLAACMLLFAGAAVALHPKDFQGPEEEARYRALAKELRCVMCQNQSLADSPAGVADDMRLQVLTLIREGKSDAEITAFFQARYGDFILYRPEVKPVTWALWFGPALLLLVGAGVVVSVVRRQQASAPSAPPTDDRQEW